MVASRSPSAHGTSIASFSRRRSRFRPLPMPPLFSTKLIHPYDVPRPPGGQQFERPHEGYLALAFEIVGFYAVSTDIDSVSEHVLSAVGRTIAARSTLRIGKVADLLWLLWRHRLGYRSKVKPAPDVGPGRHLHASDA
jgi:hypothetical protein